MNKQVINETKNEDGVETHISTFADRFYRTLYELLQKVHMSKANSLDDYFGMVFKAIKADDSVPRCIAFIKRLLQMSFLNEANFIAASLLIISEIIKLRSDIKLALFPFGNTEVIVKEAAEGSTSLVKLDQAGSDDDEEERFIDVDKVMAPPKTEVQKTVYSDKYDPHKREPKFANADNSSLFELAALCRHSHPTVRLWAQSLIDGSPLSYSGDPILDFSIANFLDRIAYKEPKSAEKLAKF